jgi:hypothetical protein
VDDVDEVALEDAPGSPGAFGGLVADEEFLCGRVEAFLHDGCGVEDAVEAAVAAAVQAVAFFAGGLDRDRGAAGVAGKLGRCGEPGDVADLSDQHGGGDVADSGDLQAEQAPAGWRVP